MSEKIALVVLSYNGLKVSQKFYEHLSKNTDLDRLQVIWIDNGSTDNTQNWLGDLVDSNSNFTCFLNTKNEGVIGGRNMGFDVFMKGKTEKSGEVDEIWACNYLMFLDNDQYVQEGWLDQHLAALGENSMVGVESWQMNKTFIPVRRNDKPSDWYNYVGCGGMLIKRSAVMTIGKFDPVFNPSYYEDPDYCFRAAELGLKVGWNYEHRIVHHPHQTLGVSPDRNQRFINSLNAFRKKWGGKEPPHFIQAKLNS